MNYVLIILSKFKPYSYVMLSSRVINKSNLHPIMGVEYDKADYHPIDLSSAHLQSIGVKTTPDLKYYLDKTKTVNKVQWLIGGYLEHRSLYKSELFDNGLEENIRDIHLGLDIWGPRDSPIYAPLDGVIHSFAYNDNDLDYGYTLILQHHIEGEFIHTLYGHLSSAFFDLWEVGQNISAGDHIASIGDLHENGGWLPHLHFQLIVDMQKKKGDYPGVCSRRELAYYRENCPDGNLFIRF